MSFRMKGPTFFNSPFKQKPKKSTESAHGQLDDAEADYKADLAAEKCAKCSKPKRGHDDSTHAFTTSASDPDYEGGDTYDVKPKVDPDAPGTKGKPGYEPPVRREDLDEAGKKIWDSHRKPK